MLTVETPLGTLRASESDYYDHPGIWIEFRKNGEAQFDPLVLVEYVDDEADLPEKLGAIITRVWKYADEDEYTTRIVHESVSPSSADEKER